MKSLPSEYYTDAEIYQCERSAIFRTEWWLLCPERMVAQPGTYFSDCVSGWPVFAIRGVDGTLRAFKNVCRHRGAVLLESGCGSVKKIICPYHGWVYGDSGRLLSAPNFSDSSELPDGEHKLLEAELGVWNGLIFIKLARGEGVGFDQWIGDIDRLSLDYPKPADLEYHGEFCVSGALNWKLYCENTVEGYHLHSVHGRLGRAVAGGSVELRSVNSGAAVAFDVEYADADNDGRSGKGLWIYSFPGFQLVFGKNIFKAERVESVGMCRTRSTNWSWYGAMDPKQREDALDWAESIVREDMGICASVFENMQAGTYEPGPLSPKMEVHVAALQERVRRAVNPGR